MNKSVEIETSGHIYFFSCADHNIVITVFRCHSNAISNKLKRCGMLSNALQREYSITTRDSDCRECGESACSIWSTTVM